MSVAVLRSTIRSCSFGLYPSSEAVILWFPNVTFLKVCGALVGRPLSRVTAAPGGSVSIVRSPSLGPFTTEEDGFFKMKGIEQSSKVAAQTNQTHKGILFRRLMELSPPIGASA